MVPVGAAVVAVAVTDDDLDDCAKHWGEPDVDDNHDCLEIPILEDALTYRWSSLGRVFVENYAASLAQILHAHEVFVINDIDHIDWETCLMKILILNPLMSKSFI